MPEMEGAETTSAAPTCVKIYVPYPLCFIASSS